MLKRIFLISLFTSQTLIVYANDDAEHNSSYTVLKDRQARLVFEQCSRMTPSFRTGYRELDQESMAKIDAFLAKEIPEKAKTVTDKPINFDQYYRQYVPFEALQRRFIYVNAFDKNALDQWAGDDPKKKDIAANWREKAVIVCGGGIGFWGAIYSEDNNAVPEFIINGAPSKRKLQM